MQSDLDNFVREFRARTEHTDWYTMTIDEVSRTYCGRCGKPQDQLRAADGSYFPCRGFTGDL